jgi:transcription elongation factor GreA
MTDDKREYLTKEKYDELKEELDHLQTIRRKEIAESLEYARSLGDLSENAEYQEARELQAATEERIAKLESILQSAKIVDHKEGDVVTIGSHVVITKDGDSEKHQYEIVGSEEADMQKRRVSHLSPLGKALMGKKKKDVFFFDTPNGNMKYKVIDVK